MHAHATKARSGRGSSAPPASGASTPALLALQRAAGNKAVSAYLQRDPAEPQAQQSSTTAVTFSDLGTVEVTSVNFPRQPNVGMGGGASGGKPAPDALREVSLTMAVTEQTAKLMQAAATGRSFDRVVIRMAAMNIVLTDVMVSGNSLSGGHGEVGGTAMISLAGLTAHVESAVDAISGA